ncbi:MAG: hypothetical protein FWB88_11955 [Defluviitaleaceae bacterium]|nr:hypothetical protein [Defluviitaleaceae bacterium]
MDQRLVKPIFWPVLLLSCVALSVTTFFLIGGMISSRSVAFHIRNFAVPGEDYLIAFLVGVILFITARIVVNNALEPSKVAISLMFIVIAVVALAIFAMHHALVVSDHVDFAAFEGHRMHPVLADMPRGVRHLDSYRGWATYLTASGFDLLGRFYIALHRALYLSYGIIAGIIFLVLQTATCFLLFFKTKPPKRIFKQTH